MDKEALEAAAKEERLKYFREWRRNNPDKVKQHNKNYWEKKAKAKLKKVEKANDTKEETNHADSKGDS
ncbi:hypothetical protein [Heliorestis convoluta]|uniref:Uncharacterized protein n=1 Tax=Heliorestis convoluta TaxID=356322 RepID=A0A5Q2MXT9_9FIRM|nr:hypothetical protein [Heliorestis convoluta]QGG47407.1 hypothetical protein FTV88_1260 [Heliorestis convoluta]